MKNLIKIAFMAIFLSSATTLSAQCPQKQGCDKKQKCEKKCEKKDCL